MIAGLKGRQQAKSFVLMGLSGQANPPLLAGVNGLNPVVRGAVRVNDGGRAG